MYIHHTHTHMCSCPAFNNSKDSKGYPGLGVYCASS